jgi:hypothetical protein
MAETPSGVSRRQFLASGGTLLAGFTLGALLPDHAFAAGAAGSGDEDLALNRPVAVSSTDYAPVPAEFAVDGLAEVGTRGSGWRAAQGDPQWIAVDLQAPCRVTSVVLTFEAALSDPTFVGSGGSNPRNNTSGFEVLSAAATAFTLDVSTDGKTWTIAYETTAGPGGVTTIDLGAPVTARWLRLTATRRSNGNPLGLNGFSVYGESGAHRPAAKGWTTWPVHHGAAPALTTAPDGSVPLESGWDLTMDDWAGSADGSVLSGPAIDTSGWLPATVPGTVLASLVEQGHLPDPVYGFNNLHVPEALSRHAWWYRRTFELPHGLPTGPGRHVWLEFDGINHQADVWVNGKSAGQLVHPFARAAFDLTGALNANGAQHVAVKISPMPYPGSPSDKGPEGISFTDAGALEMSLSSPTYLAVSGWDWMPAVRDRVSGIWNHVRLRSTGAAVIGDPRVDSVLPDLPSVATAEVTITVPVRNVASTAQHIAVTAAFDKVRVTKTVTVAAGESAEVAFAPIRLAEPKLWWPNGYGEPNLHDLTVTATLGAAHSDTKVVRFGIRQFDYQYKIPIQIDLATDSATQTLDIPAQTARYLRIQGGRRATSWGISIWTLSVLDSASPGTDLARGATATASSIDQTGNEAPKAVDGDAGTRWSSDYTDDQWIQVDLGAAKSFDRVTIVWEVAYAADFTIQVSDDGSAWTDVEAVDNSPTPLRIVVNGTPVFCRGGSWGWDELLRRMTPERMDAAMAMHRDMNFTMVRNWIGSSDREEFFAYADKYGLLVWNEFWDGFSIDPANHDVYIAQAKDTVLRYRTHPSIVVWFGCNEGSPPSVIDDALREAVTSQTTLLYQSDSNAGIITGDGPYYWVDPSQYFTGNATGGNIGFHSEIGLPTVPVVESMRNLVGPDDPGWPIGAPWFLHDWCSNGNQAPQTYLAAIQARLGDATGLEGFCERAQFVNYESMRAIFEAWNARLWDNATGVLLWMSNPAWHSTVWQTYDYDLDVNGSYYGARKGCEPVHIQASLHDWSVVAVNHTPIVRTGLVASATLHDLTGKQLGEPVTGPVSLAASATASAFTVAFGDSLPACHLLRLHLRDGTGAVLSENTYWRYRKDTDMQALNTNGTATLALSAGHAQAGQLVVSVRNTGRTVAAMVRLSARHPHTGDRILPTLYSDNFFWLLPGEQKTVTMSWTSTVATPKVVADAYNAPAVTA